MAIKSSYKIPNGLDMSILDTQIVLSTRKGMALRPLPIKVIGGFVAGGIFVFWLIQSKFMRPSSILLKIFMTIFLVMLLSMLLMPDATGKSRYVLVPALLDYLQKSNRKVIVRYNKPANNFMLVSGIERLYPKNGVIKFIDGSFGYLYRVVGNASVLLFDEDKDVILDRVGKFYRKMKTDYQMIFITAKNPQHVNVQLDNIKQTRRKMQVKDKDLDALANMDNRIIKQSIGSNFRSISQYLIIKAPNPEALDVGKEMLLNECSASSLMFRDAEALFDDDMIRVLGSIYKGRESV